MDAVNKINAHKQILRSTSFIIQLNCNYMPIQYMKLIVMLWLQHYCNTVMFSWQANKIIVWW